MKLKVSYEEWENRFSQLFPAFAPRHLRGCHSEVSPWPGCDSLQLPALGDRSSLPDCDYICWEPRGLHCTNIGLHSH